MNGKPITDTDKRVVATLYPDTATTEIARIMKRKIKNVYRIAYLIGVRKSETYLNKILRAEGERLRVHGKDTRFKKGQTSWNKGMKGLHIPGSEKGQFKKGNLPANTKTDGAITIRFHKTGHRGGKRPYQHIRIALNKWKLLHQHIWEKRNGLVPDGMLVTFIDGNSLNCELSNLMLITKEQNFARLAFSDTVIAMRLAQKGQTGKGKYDKKLQAELLKHKDLIEAKRKQMLLNKTIKKGAL